MLCKNPYAAGPYLMFGCGQCLPCRTNRRRLWTHRMMLESLKHSQNAFITLTYDEASLPTGGTLVPEHARNFLKRLRKRLHPLKIRYFLVGEYGEQSSRPHYHAAIFGIGRESAGIIQECWMAGFTYTGDLTKDSAQYIAGYVTKKMTAKDDVRLNGRHPEFARMSLRPGIGATAMVDVKDLLETEYGSDLLLDGDVPSSLQHGGKSLPLGRYLRKKLREALCFKNTDAPKETLLQMQKDMQELLSPYETLAQNSAKTPKKLITELNVQRVRNLEARYKLYKKKEVL